MVQYGAFLQRHRVHGWEKYYVDYKALKKQIRRHQDRMEHAPEDSEEVQKVFSESLDAQIERCVLFFLEQQGLLAARLQRLHEEQQSLPLPDLGERVPELMDHYRDAGKDLLQLVVFVEMNATAVRKILKKFDRRVGVSLGSQYIASRSGHQYSHLKQIFKQVGIAAIVGTIVQNLDSLHRKAQGVETPTGRSPPRLGSTDSDASTSSSLRGRTSFSLYRRPDVVEYVAREEPIIREIEAARAKLSSAVSLTNYMANTLLLPATPAVVPAELEPEYDWWSLQLNQFNTFLYMVNYYIIVPTSDQYAEDLNAPASLCGVIIGATPLCALVSSLLFSKWSNRSYSEPLYASTVMLIVGNLCYAVALDFKSVPLLLIGRALEGLGGARAINRRYISDHVPTKQRAAASAAFVSAGALGMAAGPFVAGLLTSLKFELAGWTVNEVTSPGWLMAATWALYILALAVFFKEPSRAHLDRAAELATKEELRKKGETAATNGGDLERPLLSGSGSNPDFAPSETTEEDDEDRKGDSGAVETLADLAKELTPSIMVLLWIYFMLKFAIEVLISESSLVTKSYFKWNVIDVGNFLGVLGLTVLPISTVVGNYISNIYEDRAVVLWTQVIMAVGTVGNLHLLGRSYPEWQYVTSALCIFVACNVLEGVNLSLLSRIMSPRLSRGTFNCGLLSTEAGTFARVVGDGLITAIGYRGTDYVLNFTMIPVLVCIVSSIVYTKKYYYALY